MAGSKRKPYVRKYSPVPDPEAEAEAEAEWLEFEKRLGISDSSLFQSSSPENFYVITTFASADDINDGFALYVIDIVNSESNMRKKPLHPILIWDLNCPYFSFVMYDFKLYMFCGLDDVCWNNSWAVYDMRRAPCFSSSSFHTIDLRDKKFEEGNQPIEEGKQPMEGRKVSPSAVVIGDSTICVFGKVLFLKGENDSPYPRFSRPSFELLDTRNDTWTPLPEPMTYDENGSNVGIESFCVHGSSLIIYTNLGFYGINIAHKPPLWVKLDGPIRHLNVTYRENWTMVGKQLCSPFDVMGRAKLTSTPLFPPKACPDRNFLITRYPSGAICLGGVDDSCFNLCRVRLGFVNLVNNVPNLLVDIVKFDKKAFENYGSDLSKWHGIRCHKYFTFALASCPCDHMELVSCFPVKGTGAVEELNRIGMLSSACLPIKEKYTWHEVKELKNLGLQVALESGGLRKERFISSLHVRD
ncbi:hypothetical protein M5689_018888 [Euphorbia peplus]|nr:hypothetical protein M5689_018882 [Euphorbia peplus]WCJ37786.1 hypothetical protein M5689_018888 [Euphorbia peplus]